MDLAAYVRDIPDFPQPGVLFRDITPLLGDPRAFGEAVHRLASEAERCNPEAIVGIESRGFLFGGPVAISLGLPFVPVRKPGKLPAERMSIEYALEYGANQLDIHKDGLAPGQRAFIIDDVLATGGTAAATAALVELLGAVPAGFGFLIEIRPLEGRQRLAGYPVASLVSY